MHKTRKLLSSALAKRAVLLRFVMQENKPSEIPASLAEKILSEASLCGIIPTSREWSLQLLADLYSQVRETTAENYPPPGFEPTSQYVPVSYVQSPYNPPSNWAATVYAVLSALQRKRGTVYGIWFDKMGSRQYPALQKVWGPLANLHYALRPVIHVSPMMQNHKHHLEDEVVCALNSSTYHITLQWLRHHQTCSSCLGVWHSHVHQISFQPSEFDIGPPEEWVHPGAYFRCWPMVERSLALCNRGLLTTHSDLSTILATCIALCGLQKTIRDIRTKSHKTDEADKGFRILSHYVIHSTYTCPQAIALAQAFLPAYEHILFAMAERMATDCTKAKPITAENPYQMARKLRGWTSGRPATFIPLFADDLFQRYDVTESPTSTIDFALAMTDIVVGWAGRAPCFASGDKIAAVVLFANFELGSRISRENGSKWLQIFVDQLYDEGRSLFNEQQDVGLSILNSDPFKNYKLFPASVGQAVTPFVCRMSTSPQHGGAFEESLHVLYLRSEMRNSFGRYSGCIPFEAFVNFLAQCNKTDEQMKNLLVHELCLWQREIEYDGEIFALEARAPLHYDSQERRSRLSSCPKCKPQSFSAIGTLWRSKGGEMGVRRFWALAKTEADGSDSTSPVAGVLLGTGMCQVDTTCASRCLVCNAIAERNILRGWPRGVDDAWEAVFVLDESTRPPPPPSRLRLLRPAKP